MSETAPMVRLEGVRFRYPDSDFELAVDALEVRSGSRTAVIGPSGSGKTTLLALVAGIRTPHPGRVLTAGVEVSALGDGARRDFRIRRVGLVFQAFELLAHLDVRDNILLPYRLHPALTLDAEVRDRAAGLARRLGLADKLDRPVDRLSQGERQRVAVCRALVTAPPLLLADEPTGNLDPPNKARVLDALFDAVDATGATLLTVTHDHDLLERFERVIDVKRFHATDRPADELVEAPAGAS